MTTIEANPRRFSRNMGEYRNGTFTQDAIRIASALNRAGIACELEHTVVRYGVYNKRGIQKTYSIDILVCDNRYDSTAIEVEGEGSASRDNLERDQYLGTLGIRVLHVDNKTPGQDVIVRLNGSFKKQQVEFP